MRTLSINKLVLILLDVFSRSVMALFIFAVICSAIVTAGLRHYLPHVDDYRAVILEQLNKNPSGMIVSAEKINSDWRPFRPALSFNNVSIKHPDWDKALELDALALEMDLLRSAFSGGLRFSRIELDKLAILLTESESGRWSLAGFVGQQGEPLDVQVLLENIWNIGHIQLSDIRIRMRPFDEQDIALPAVQIDMVSSGSSKRIVASLSAKQNKISQLYIETDGEPYADDFSAQAYWKLDDYQVAEFWDLLNMQSHLQSAMLGGEFWLNWNEDEIDLRGKVNLDEMLLHSAEDNKEKLADPIKIDRLSSQFLLQYKSEELQFWAPEIYLRHSDVDVHLKNIAWQQGAKTKLQLAYVDIAPLVQFAGHLPFPEKIKQVLKDLAPAGELENIHVELEKEEDKPFDFSLIAQLHSVSASAWKGAPAVENINGVVTASKLSGEVQLLTDNFSLAFPKLYDNDMQFNQAQGLISWFLDDQNIHVKGLALALSGDYGDATGEFYLQIPKDKMRGDVGRLILDVGIENSDAKYKDRFIPKTLPPKLLSWLGDNIHAGTVKKAGFIYHGPISLPAIELDVIEDKKVVQLWLDVEGGRLSYFPGWPVVEEARAKVLLDDKEVFAQVAQAEMAGINIQDTIVAVESVDQGQRVHVQAFASGKTEAVIGILQQPVLAKKLGFMRHWTSPIGHVVANVEVSAIVQDAKKSLSLDVRSKITKATLDVGDYRLGLKNINGSLDFNLTSGLSSAGLQASFWQQPIKAAIQSTGRGKNSLTDIQFSTVVSAKDLTAWSKQPVFSLLEGRSNVFGTFYYGAHGAGLDLRSDLKGMVINLPDPFAKQSDHLRSFTLHMPFSGKEKELTAKLGAGVDIRFLLEQGTFSAGQINLGLKKSNYQKNKIVVGGQVATVDAHQWLDTFKSYQKYVETMGSAVSTAKDTTVWRTSIEKLHIRQLDAYGHSLENVKFDLFDASAFWQMAVEHPRLSGSLIIPREKKPMRLHLQYVDLDILSAVDALDLNADKKPLNSMSEADMPSLANPELADFPDIDVIVDSVWWKKQDYGEWQFEVRTNKDQFSLENLQASVKYMRLGPNENSKAALRWSLGENSRTQFNGRFTADNLADALGAWGYSQEVISRTAQFDVDAAWQGVATDFDFSQVVGNTKFQWRDGSFADVSSSQSGALKVVGFFNIGLLVKRLQLDFSDLSSKGLAYDSVDGQLYFDEGLLTLKDELTVIAPSSKIQLKGWADLNTETVDMNMGVSLPVATNLPWIVALAAGLPAAAGVFIVSKLLKKQVSALFSAVYKVNGNLNDPKVEFVRLFDTGLPDLSEADLPAKALSKEEEVEAKAELEALEKAEAVLEGVNALEKPSAAEDIAP